MNEPAKLSQLTNYLLELEEDPALDLTKARLSAGEDPLTIIQEAQLGLRLVGERYEQGQYYVMGMMMAGEIFREIMELIQPYLQVQFSGGERGIILLGTVKGDIHDIGKNIFSLMLRSQGFHVEDLGTEVPPSRFVEEALRLKPDVIALSGLLTVSYETMKATVQLVHQISDPQVAATPFIIGGGTVNAMVCAYIGADYWASDAVVGVQICQQIMAARSSGIKKETGKNF
ncbi:MAG: cobalamin-dependent protein [Anaerolineaceae bacterium]|nr:cobalamin-dependent protein [Anaerolineaceae bacterium]